MYINPMISLNGMEISGIPADLIAHLFVGAIIYGFFRATGLSFLTCICIVCAFAFQKEYFDWNMLAGTGDIFEPVKDISISIAGGVGASLVNHRS